MHLNDTFYVALCMTILILGVVYWFWTQNQFVLRKLNLLNNIVFEMRAQRNAEDMPTLPVQYPPAPGSELGEDEDLLHEELHAETKTTVPELQEPPAESDSGITQPAVVEAVETEADKGTPIDDLSEPLDQDLQPGGVGSGVKEIVSHVFDTMTLKELRRLAEQRGIQGTSNMRKTALIEALREGQKSGIKPFESGTVDLS